MESESEFECRICYSKISPIWKTVITRCCSFGIFCQKCFIRLDKCPQCKQIAGFDGDISNLSIFEIIEADLISAINLDSYISKSNIISVIDYMSNLNVINKRDTSGKQLLYYLTKAKIYADSIIYLLEQRDLDLELELELELEERSNEGMLPIHYICKYQTETVCLRILDIYSMEGLNLEIRDGLGWLPIHYICRWQTETICNRILDIYQTKGLDLECSDKLGWLPIHYICRWQTEAVCNRILDIYQTQSLDLEVKNKMECLPIHYICSWQTEAICLRILDIYSMEGLDLECRDNSGKTPIDYINEYQTVSVKRRVTMVHSSKFVRLCIKIDEFLRRNGINDDYVCDEFLRRNGINDNYVCDDLKFKTIYIYKFIYTELADVSEKNWAEEIDNMFEFVDDC